MGHSSILFSALLVTALVPDAGADTISTWNGGAGNWSNAADWTPPQVPNNSGANAYDVTIGLNGNVGLDISPTINSLTVATFSGTDRPGVLHAVSAGNTLTVVKDASINGTLLFGTTAFFGPLPIQRRSPSAEI